MSLGGGKAMHTLDLRESRSSLAGVMMAAAMEGIGLYEFSKHVVPHLDDLPKEIGEVVSRVNLPAIPGAGALSGGPEGSSAVLPPEAAGGADAAGANGAGGGGAAAAGAPAPANNALPTEPKEPKAAKGGGADAADGGGGKGKAKEPGAPGRGGADAAPADAQRQPAALQQQPPPVAPLPEAQGRTAPIDASEFGQDGTG